MENIPFLKNEMPDLRGKCIYPINDTMIRTRYDYCIPGELFTIVTIWSDLMVLFCGRSGNKPSGN